MWAKLEAKFKQFSPILVIRQFVNLDITDIFPLHILMHFTKEEVKQANDELLVVQKLAKENPETKFCFQILNKTLYFNF